MYHLTHIKSSAFVLLGLCIAATSNAKTIFVDPALSSDCESTYSASARSCSGGTYDAYTSVDEALLAAQPGDEVLIRGGNYGQISPDNSGSLNLPITIKNYADETVNVSNSGNVAISIIGKSDIIIDGLNVSNSLGFGRLEESTRITIRNSAFSSATSSGTTGAIKLVRSSYNRIENNTFEDGSDIMVIQDASDNNLILSNTFDTASHSLLSIRCSNNNVIRDNQFSNPNQKAVEIYDCEGISDAPYRLDSTKRNIFENNLFSRTLATSADHRYNAIQHSGQYNVVRNNVFRNCEGGGVNYQHYSDEALFVYGNRMYNNTFYQNSCHAIIGDNTTSPDYYDNRAINNLLYKNVDCDGNDTQIRIPNTSTVILSGNALATSDPRFTDESSFDFNLAENSAFIDAGIFLTTTIGSGSSDTITVHDATFFYDGFGISGEQGDTIQLEGSSATARIVSVDYSNKTLVLDKPLTWNDGQGVTLRYTGSAPDIGAFERSSGGSAIAPPSPPYNLRAVEE